MIPRPPVSTRTDTRCPDATLFRAVGGPSRIGTLGYASREEYTVAIGNQQPQTAGDLVRKHSGLPYGLAEHVVEGIVDAALEHRAVAGEQLRVVSVGLSPRRACGRLPGEAAHAAPPFPPPAVPVVRGCGMGFERWRGQPPSLPFQPTPLPHAVPAPRP